MAPFFFSTYIMPGNNISNLGQNFFHFELARIPKIIYNVQEVALPNFSMAEQDQPTTLGIPIKRPIGAYKFDNLQISFLVDEYMQNWLELYRWMRHLGNIDSDCDNNSLAFNKWMTTATLHITKGTYNDNLKVIFREIFPIGLSGLRFTSTAAAYQPQVATATFAYTYYSFDPDPGNISN